MIRCYHKGSIPHDRAEWKRYAMAAKMSVEDQVALLMQGAEYGDEQLKQAMQAELKQRLLESEKTGQPLRVYCGYDPTSPDLHLGHTVTMRKLRQFQDLGHEVTFVIGSFTALVGDPSDKDGARPRLSREKIAEFAETYTEQAFKILDPERTKVRFNDEWLSQVTLEQFIDMASNFTVQQFLARDNFSKRYAAGHPIWVHELFYALLQGYDATVLETDVQLGATEQLFNLLAGRKLQEALGQRPQIAITLPVLVGTDGSLRMAKSTGNTIGITDEPAEMYGKVMSLPDNVMGNYFRLVTRWTPKEVAALEAQLESGEKHPRDVKMALAREIVEIYHGERAALEAEEAFRRVFQQGDVPDEMDEHRLKEGVTLLEVMMETGLAASRSAGRRLIEQRGVRLEDEVLEDPNQTFDLKQPAVLRVGKRRFLRLLP
jgi:tyrosyl-tRNA synthetase